VNRRQSYGGADFFFKCESNYHMPELESVLFCYCRLNASMIKQNKIIK